MSTLSGMSGKKTSILNAKLVNIALSYHNTGHATANQMPIIVLRSYLIFKGGLSQTRFEKA